MSNEASSVNANVATNSDISVPVSRWPANWHAFLEKYKIGLFPLPLYLLVGGLIATLVFMKELKPDLIVMALTLAFFGFLCGTFGKCLPVLGKLGAAAICATFIPSFLVYKGWLPQEVVSATTEFYKSSNILYVYICFVIVGSIMSMDRATLIQGFVRIFIPMLCGEIVGMLVGTGVGVLLGYSPFHAFFFLVLPIMAGGVGEGAIPLSVGYMTIFHAEQGEMLGQILPIVMLGGLTAIILAGLLNQLGKHKPHLTGNGRLLPSREDDAIGPLQSKDGGSTDISAIASAGLMALSFYVIGSIGQHLTGLPAPVAMLFVAVAAKLLQIASPSMLDGSKLVYNFAKTGMTYPILFAVGVAITPWQTLVAAFTLTNIVIIVSTVVSLVTTGFFVGKLIGMYPIDVAIVTCCNSGQGGTGDVAILTAADRMALMPFAQIATRIGGAINVALFLALLNAFYRV